MWKIQRKGEYKCKTSNCYKYRGRENTNAKTNTKHQHLRNTENGRTQKIPKFQVSQATVDPNDCSISFLGLLIKPFLCITKIKWFLCTTSVDECKCTPMWSSSAERPSVNQTFLTNIFWYGLFIQSLLPKHDKNSATFPCEKKTFPKSNCWQIIIREVPPSDLNICKWTNRQN